MSDARFKKLSSDPRFIKAKKDAHKVSLDSRFSHMLESTEFTGKKKTIDKRGKRVDEKDASKDLRRFYKIESEDEYGSESGSENEVKAKADLARGEGNESSSEEEFDEDEIAALDEEGPWADQEVPIGDETARLACVNLDWDHVKANDLYKVFDAFKPAQGIIAKVSIYPSEFGKECMAKESIQGPPTSIFKEEEKQVLNDEGKDFNMVALRKYQVDRLRYYYAVVDCDCIATARAIFSSCDGTEFESSANFFDLRYIPENMEFTDPPTDTATLPPAAYQPVEFVTQALQHSKVKLTWDADDVDRQKTTRKKFSRQDIKDMDFKAYLASDSEDEVDEDLKNKYRSLVAGSESDDEGAGDMEITFNPGLSENASRLLDERKEKELQEGETVFEKQLRTQKEKKKARKLAKSVTVEQPESESDDMGREDLDDPFFQTALGSDFEEEKVPVKDSRKGKKQLSKSEKAEVAKSKAELELLLLDDTPNNAATHFSAKDVLKSEKGPRSKKEKKKMQKTKLDAQEDFKMDFADPRFAPLIEDHEFFIDPTNPQFKKTNTMAKILEKKREKRTLGVSDKSDSVGITKSTKLHSLVDSIKRKAASANLKGKRQKI